MLPCVGGTLLRGRFPAGAAWNAALSRASLRISPDQVLHPHVEPAIPTKSANAVQRRAELALIFAALLGFSLTRSRSRMDTTNASGALDTGSIPVGTTGLPFDSAPQRCHPDKRSKRSCEASGRFLAGPQSFNQKPL